MKETEKKKFKSSVDRYLIREGAGPNKDDEVVVRKAAEPVTIYLEGRRQLEIVNDEAKGHLFFQRWTLDKFYIYAANTITTMWLDILIRECTDFKSPKADIKNFVGLNGLRYLRSIYPDIPLDPFLHNQLDRIDKALPGNPLIPAFSNVYNKIQTNFK